MAAWHLRELEAALGKRGWRVVAETSCTAPYISATWKLERAGDTSALLLDFEGIDDLRTLPVERSYACRIRNTAHVLYLRRMGNAGTKQRETWRRELLEFVAALSVLPQS